MTIAEWLFEAMRKLGDAGVDSPRRDALVLLEDTLGKDRTWVLAHPEHHFQGSTLEMVNKLVERRMKREPLAYIRGKAWFYGRFFNVSPDVMIPRPESEDFIDILKEIKPKMIVDVGTGSGCLAITAVLEIPGSHATAIDISAKALDVARGNAKRHKATITFQHADLLESLKLLDGDTTALVANVPYVPAGLITSPEINHEPAEALFSGVDGLDHYRKLWEQLAVLPERPRYVLTESLISQHRENTRLAASAGYDLVSTDTLVQFFSASSGERLLE